MAALDPGRRHRRRRCAAGCPAAQLAARRRLPPRRPRPTSGARGRRPGRRSGSTRSARVNLLEAALACDPAAPGRARLARRRSTGAATGAPLSEDAPLRPVTPYASSKVAAEFLGLQAFLGNGLEVVRARPFNHVGPGQAEQLRRLGPRPAHRRGRAERRGRGRGRQPHRRPGLHRRPRRRAGLPAARRRRASPGEVYNVCSGSAITTEELFKRMVAMAKVPIEPVQDPSLFRPVDVAVLVGDGTRLHRADRLAPRDPARLDPPRHPRLLARAGRLRLSAGVLPVAVARRGQGRRSAGRRGTPSSEQRARNGSARGSGSTPATVEAREDAAGRAGRRRLSIAGGSGRAGARGRPRRPGGRGPPGRPARARGVCLASLPTLPTGAARVAAPSAGPGVPGYCLTPDAGGPSATGRRGRGGVRPRPVVRGVPGRARRSGLPEPLHPRGRRGERHLAGAACGRGGARLRTCAGSRRTAATGRAPTS